MQPLGATPLRTPLGDTPCCYLS